MRLNLNDIRYIINESYNRLMLTEISNNAIETLFKKYLPQYTAIMDRTLTELDTLDVVDLGKNSGVSENYSGIMILGALETTEGELNSAPNMKLKDYLRLKLMKTFEINRGRGPIKYLRGIIRISFDKNEGINLFSLNGTNKPLLTRFRQIVDYICVYGLDFNEDLNGLSLEELNATVGSQMRIEAYKKWLDNKDKGQKENVFGEYKVVPISSHAEASRYSQFTSWCVTQEAHHYDLYTSDNSQFYFCLKNGFENVRKKRGEDCPLDEYGLSMVSVLIRPDNTVKHITTRWNHNNKGEDNPNLKTLEQIENVLGIPQSAFIYKGIPEINELDINELLNQGIDISSLIKKGETIGNMVEVSYGKKHNVMKDGKLLMKNWYQYIFPFSDTCFKCIKDVVYNVSYITNLCDERGQMFPDDVSYDITECLNEEHSIFKGHQHQTSKKINLFKRGISRPLLDEDALDIYPFHQGISLIETASSRYNFVDTDGRLLWAEDKELKVSRDVTLQHWNNGMLIIGKQGFKTYYDIYNEKPLTTETFRMVFPFGSDMGLVKSQKGYNFVRRDGTLRNSEEWFKSADTLNKEYQSFLVTDYDGVRFIFTNDGEFIKVPDEWKDVIYFNDGYGCAWNARQGIIAFDSNKIILFTVKGAMYGYFADGVFYITDFEDGDYTLIYNRFGKFIKRLNYSV